MLKKSAITLFICINMIMFSAAPAFAWVPNFTMIKTQDELEAIVENENPGVMYALSGQVEVNKSINLKTDNMFVLTPNTDDIGGTIVIEDGGELIIDAPEIYTNADGRTNLIRVKKGGKLVLKSGTLTRPTSIWPETASTAVIEEGGICEVYKGFELNYKDWDFKYLIDGEVTYIDGPYDPGEPEEPEEPEYIEDYYGEVVKVDESELMTIYFAMPVLDEDIKGLTVQSFDGEKWNDRIYYDQDEYMPEGYFRYSPDEVVEYLSWNHRNCKRSFLAYPEKWIEETAGEYVTYRIIYHYEDDYEMSQPVDILIPETGEPMPFTTEHDYDDVDGNRGGIGQGESERHPVPDKPEGTPEVKPEPGIPAKPEAKPEPEIPAKPEAKPEFKPETPEKPEVKPEVKPQVRPEIQETPEQTVVLPEVTEKPETENKEDNSISEEKRSEGIATTGIVIATGATGCVAGAAYGISKLIMHLKKIR